MTRSTIWLASIFAIGLAPAITGAMPTTPGEVSSVSHLGGERDHVQLLMGCTSVDSERCADAERIARRGRGADDVRPKSEPVCDDHGTDICARSDHSSDQLARRGRGRGADDVKPESEPVCDDHGTDICARSDHSSDQLARRGRGRGADDFKQRRPEPRCDDHGTDVCLVNG